MGDDARTVVAIYRPADGSADLAVLDALARLALAVNGGGRLDLVHTDDSFRRLLKTAGLADVFAADWIGEAGEPGADPRAAPHPRTRAVAEHRAQARGGGGPPQRAAGESRDDIRSGRPGEDR